MGLLARVVMSSFSHSGEFYLSQSAQSSRRFLAHISSPQDSGPSPNPFPAGRGVVCEVTPTGLLAYFVEVFALTELTEPLGTHFEPTEGLRHTENTERFSYRRYRQGATSSLHPAHRGISVITPLPFGGGEGGGATIFTEPCVFCSSVFLCEKKNNCETRWGVFSLTELTDLTEPFCALFRTHRRPPAYRIHRTFQLKMVVRLCDIG